MHAFTLTWDCTLTVTVWGEIFIKHFFNVHYILTTKVIQEILYKKPNKVCVCVYELITFHIVRFVRNKIIEYKS